MRKWHRFQTTDSQKMQSWRHSLSFPSINQYKLFFRFPWEFNCVMPVHKFKYHSHITLTLLRFLCFYVILIGLKTDVLNVTALKLIFIISQCTVTTRRQNMDSLVLKYPFKNVDVIPLFTGVSNCCCSFGVKNS